MTIHRDTTALDAVNSEDGDTDPPSEFRTSDGELIATSAWHATDAWRGYWSVTAAPGFRTVLETWITGDWSDAPTDHSESEVLARITALEAEHGDVWVIGTPTSNVFSTGVDVLARAPEGL